MISLSLDRNLTSKRFNRTQRKTLNFKSSPNRALLKQAELIHNSAKENAPIVLPVVKSLTEGLGKVVYRIKQVPSILDKKLKGRKLDDLIGVTMLLKAPENKKVADFLNRIDLKQKNKSLNLLSVKNYYDDIMPPFIGTDIFNDFLKSKSPHTKFKSKTYHNGYTSSILRFDIKSIPTEIQVMGESFNKLCRKEHFLYNLTKGKGVEISDKNNSKPLRDIADAYIGLNKEQRQKYDNYWRALYKKARFEDAGLLLPRPKLDKDIPKILNIENVEKVYDKFIKSHDEKIIKEL